MKSAYVPVTGTPACVTKRPNPRTTDPIRERFGIPANRTQHSATRLLNEAVEARLIDVRDPEAGTRNRSYIPWLAGQVSRYLTYIRCFP